MPWTPLPRLAFAICTYPFVPSSPADLPLQLGDELYIIEEGGKDASWFRGYLVAPPSLLSGLTTSRGQTLEKRVFTGIFPRVCVEIRELLGDATGHERSASVLARDGKRRSAHDLDSSRPKRAPDASPEAQSTAGQDEPAATPSSLATSSASRPPAPVPMLKIGDESDMAKEEPLIDEIASCLREWHSTKLHDLLLSRQYAAVDSMSALVARLDYARKQLFHQVLTDRELEKLREATVWDLVNGNKMLEQDIVVRSTEQRGRILTHEDSAVDINKQQAVMSLLDERPSTASESKAPFHVYVNLKNFTADSDRPTTVGLCLYSKRVNEAPKLLSEIYTSEATTSFPGATVGFDGLRKTLFTDISPTDAGETENASVFLVVKMVSNEPPVLSHGLQASLDKADHPEDILGNLGSTFRTAGQAGLKGGRQSIMWVRNRSRRGPDAEGRTGSRLGTGASETSDPKASQPVEGLKAIKPVKKLTGLGLADITKHVRLLHEGDVSIQIASPDAAAADNSTADQTAILAHILGGAVGNQPSRAASATLSLYVKAFRADNADELIQETPTLLHSITPSHRLGFANAPRRPRSDIYVTLQRPSISDNASLSHPRAGSVPAFEDNDLSNLQLTLEVRDTNGNRIEKCIYPSANASGAVAWRSVAIERGEWWNQTIRLAIRPEQVPGSHLVMSLAEGYGFPFALCWMPLWVQGAFVQDGQHNLALYKYDEYTSTTHSGKGAYLALPWNLRNKDIAVTGPLASVEMSTYLCSTAYSQDPNLLGLLHWKEKRRDEMMKLLNKFPFVPEIEIVKLLKDVLNALFGAMSEYSGLDEYEEMLFNSFATVLAIVHDRRFNLQPVLDHYIDHDFHFPSVFPCLVRSFARLLQDSSTSTDKSRKLRATCKVGAYVMKFIVKARRQWIKREMGIGIQSPGLGSLKELRLIFTALDNLMQDRNPVLIGTKTLMVQHFHSWLPELSGVAQPDEVLAIASQFVDSCSDVQGRLVLYKLLLIKHITDENPFATGATQTLWQKRVVEWLNPYWGLVASPTIQWREQIRLCCSVVSSVFTSFGPNTSAFARKLVQSFKAIKLIPRQLGEPFSLLFPTSYPFPTRPTKVREGFDEALIEIAALLAATTNAPPSTYAEVPSAELAQILLDLLELTRCVLEFDAFPSNWLSVHIYNHRSIYTALESMFTLLLQRFLPLPDDAPEFRDDLWRSFLETLLKLVSSDALALETFPEQKRRAVWKIGGDVRELGAELLGRSWHTMGWETSPDEKNAFGLERMGGYQVSYVPGLVGSILELCLSVHEGLRHVATGVLHSMIVGEWTLNGNLQAIETAMIDSLNRLYTTKTLNDGMLQKQFIDELRGRFKSVDQSQDHRLYSAVMTLLDSISELFDLLVAVHAPEASTDTLQIMDTLRLMEYLRDMAKVDIFIGYVYKLATIQRKSRNLTEAALAMKLHADLHPWDTSEMLPRLAGLPFAAQSAFDRKEQIYFEMIKLFEDAEDWHQALQAYSELAHQYQTNVFDFTKLARAQRAMATIYEKISNGERSQSRFFRVLYRGLGFPVSLRDKQFIFQASASDRLASFTDKMQQQYPGAQFVTGATLDEIEGQYLSIYPISPQKDFTHPVNRRVRTAQPVKEYLMLAAPRQFANTTRRQAATENVMDQVQEKVVYTTADPFPTITKRSEIVSVETVRMTPVQIGLERTARKTQDLQTRINSVLDGGESSLGSLTDDLTVLVSAKGTVAGYWKLVGGVTASSADARLSAVEGVDTLQASLKVALLDHVLMIRRALDLYSRPAQTSTKASLNNDLEITFGPVLAYLETLKASTSNAAAPAPSVFSSTAAPPTKPDDSAMAKPSLKVFGANGTETTNAVGKSAELRRLSKVESHNSDMAGAFDAVDTNGEPDGGAVRSTTTKTFGAAPMLSAQTSFQNLGARVGSVRGSVTKRLSALNLPGNAAAAFSRKGRQGVAAPASPTIQEQ